MSRQQNKVAQQDTVLRVLVVPEDGLDFSGYMNFLRRQEDVEVYIVDDVKAAFERVTLKQVQAVICGLRLPGGLSGHEFLADVRRFDLVLPFFFLSNEDNQQMIASAFQAGANDFFVADRTEGQMKLIIDAVRVSAEIADMLRQRKRDKRTSIFAEKYEVVFDELREGMLMINAADGAITYSNEILAEAIGRSTESLIGTDINTLLTPHKEAVDDWRRIAALAQAEGPSDQPVMQLCFRHPNGSSKMFWTHVVRVELSDKEVLLCRLRDVTRFEKLEQEIAAIRNQLKVIVENSADAIVLCRDDGIIEFIGGAGPRMFGVSAEDMSISNLDDLFGNNGADIRKILRTMGNRSRISGIESSIFSRWGSQIPVHIAITRLPSSDAITRYLLNIMDITEQKVMEAERHMISDLIGLMSSGKPATETLPLLLRKLRTSMRITFGLVVSISSSKNYYTVAAVENLRTEPTLRPGQQLESDYLPVEEELWSTEGIVRNNLQESGLYPLESLLYKEGIRSYISLPLITGERLIGAVHFGSSNAYALNRGHLSLFKQIASALAGTALRSQKDSAIDQMHAMLGLATAGNESLQLFLDDGGRVEYASESARAFFGKDAEIDGRMIHLVLSERLLNIPGPGEILGADENTPLEVEDDAGDSWVITARHSRDESTSSAAMVQLSRQ